MENIDDLEVRLKKIGVFYRSKTEALVFALKKDKNKSIYWQNGETYGEFLNRCHNLIN